MTNLNNLIKLKNLLILKALKNNKAEINLIVNIFKLIY